MPLPRRYGGGSGGASGPRADRQHLTMHKGFVSDLRIIDISQGVAGPLASKLLADQGAEVIKVEPPEGDYSRCYAPFAGETPDSEQSLTYAFFNTSKKGVTLDVGTPDGAELLTEMARRSDVLIEDLPPGEMAELGWTMTACRRSTRASSSFR